MRVIEEHARQGDGFFFASGGKYGTLAFIRKNCFFFIRLKFFIFKGIVWNSHLF